MAPDSFQGMGTIGTPPSLFQCHKPTPVGSPLFSNYGVNSVYALKSYRYAPMDIKFEENVAANALIPDMSGLAHPAASFRFYGNLRIVDQTQFNSIRNTFSENYQSRYSQTESYLEITALASTPLTNQHNPPSISFYSKAVLKQNGVFIAERNLTAHMQEINYIVNINTFVVGEAYFELPKPLSMLGLDLSLTCSYTIKISEGSVSPRNYFGITPAVAELDFPVTVCEII